MIPAKLGKLGSRTQLTWVILILEPSEPSSMGYVASFLLFKSFLLVSTKISFWQEDWALGYDSMKFRHFSDIS